MSEFGLKQYILEGRDNQKGSDGKIKKDYWYDTGKDKIIKEANIVQLGIQTKPGIRFSINGSTETITIGHTGIYEIKLVDGIFIDSLVFDSDSINSFWPTSGSGIKGPNADDQLIIVDIIYKKSM